jgi:hypothetical protein
MRVTISFEIDTDAARPDDLAQLLAHAMALRDAGRTPAPSAPARRSREPGDDDFDDLAGYDGEVYDPKADRADGPADEDPPTDGRQLLGWASKQVPDRKGVIIGFGKKRGFRSKIVEWTAEQVAAAYQHARRAR